MAWVYYNPNPTGRNHVGDCVIRAIAKATGQSWDDVYWDLCYLGAKLGNWGNGNEVWKTYLRQLGFSQHSVPNTCPECYSVREFCEDNPNGTYIICTGANGGTHVVTSIGGDYYDAWPSGDEIPIFYFRR